MEPQLQGVSEGKLGFFGEELQPRSLSDLGRLTSENRPQRGQFLPDLQAHSPAMGQNKVSVKTNLYSSYVGAKKTVRAKCGVSQKWTAAVDLQPPLPKSDRLLAMKFIAYLIACWDLCITKWVQVLHALPFIF